MSPAETEHAARSERPYENVGFLRIVLEAVPAFVVLVDAELRILYLNRVQPGFKLEEVIGRSVEEFTAPEYHQRQREAIASALRTGEPSPFVMRTVGPGDAVAYYESRAVPVDYGAGQRAVCVIALEVTEHVARAEALRASEEKLRILVEATGMGLWSWDVATDKVEWNARMHEMTGWEEPVHPSDYIPKLVHPDDHAQVARSFESIPETGGDYRSHRIVRPDGSVRWIMPCGRAERDAQGCVVSMMGGFLDVTAQHLLEEHLRAAQKIDAVGALTAGVAHNFNNMLAVIVPTLDLLLREAQLSRKQLVLDAKHAAQRASELVVQLMTFAGQRNEGERKAQDVEPIVQRAISMCERTFAAQVKLELTRESAHRAVRCDAAAIEQVVVNLLINARDAVVLGPQHARASTAPIRVSISEEQVVAKDSKTEPRSHVRIAVRDEGVGMNAQVLARLFEPFFTTKEPGRGTGLGLATSYALIRDHGGFLRFESTSGAGTTANIYLPVDPSPIDLSAPVIEAPNASHAASHEQAQVRGTVIVIDDEAAVRSVVEAALRTLGHVAHSAFDEASVARLLALGVKPDVILLDRSMPDFPIQRALDQLRAAAPRATILFFTGQDVPAKERSLVDGVLYKPMSMAELGATVGRWLTQPRG